MYYFLGYLVLSYVLVYLILKCFSEYTTKLDHLDDPDLGFILLFSPITLFIMLAFVIFQIIVFILNPIVDKLGSLFR